MIRCPQLLIQSLDVIIHRIQVALHDPHFQLLHQLQLYRFRRCLLLLAYKLSQDVAYGVTPKVMPIRPHLLHVNDLHNVQREHRVVAEMFADDFSSPIFWQVAFVQEISGFQGVSFCLFLERRVQHQGFLQLRFTLKPSPSFERFLISIKTLFYVLYHLLQGSRL